MDDTAYQSERSAAIRPNGRERRAPHSSATSPLTAMSSAIRWRFPLLLLVVSASSVACRPAAGETPSDAAEPLSVADGYIHFSVANDSQFREKSRKAFESLISEPSRQQFSSQEIVFRPHTDVGDALEKKQRKPGRRKPLIEGRNQALISLRDPLTREVQRCETAKFRQRVKAPGCLTKVIVNRYCHGTCASYYIPRLNSKKLKAVFKSCAACVPRDYDAVNVTLDCPGQDPPQITKSIVKVKKCECIDLDMSTHLRL